MALTLLSPSVTGRGMPFPLCPNAPFTDCEEEALVPVPEGSLVEELDQLVRMALLETPPPSAFEQTGKASWYGPGFHGRKTASGVRFNQHALTAAHRTLPLGTAVKVTNLDTGRTIQVTINDRGPYIDGRIIDLSRRAAAELGMEEAGLAPVRIETLDGERPAEVAMKRGKEVEVAERPDER
ncbi:septal ring lytic transglycosylase RlpA family protein [Azospirillum sp. TSO22-1]|uniref:septal ring lytic transglycosylase RlpA family protein n=1 Tax=Azospirillum sp. TSO22-1 TaxID=716789 RepID=UPI001FFECC90|nr:septal ring lytic transglycosylase RlpA family protein [Azospirillum sp. TSO22-1]